MLLQEDIRSSVEQFLANPEMPCCYFPSSLQVLVWRAAAGFYNFLEEPVQNRERWNFHLENTLLPDEGYIKRSAKYHPFSSDVQDRKEFFHYRPIILPLLQEADLDMYGRYKPWLDICHKLLTRCVTGIAIPFAQAFDFLLPGYDFEQKVREANTQHKLRILAYDLPNGSNLIAVQHVDKSALTLHMGENYSGLHVGVPGRLIEVLPERAFLFAGRKMQIMTGGKEIVRPTGGKAAEGGYLKAVYHDARYGGDQRRWAVIVFIHIP